MDNLTDNKSSIDLNNAASIKLLNEIQEERDEDVKDYPNLLSLDWNDINVLQNYSHAFPSILAYNSLFPDPLIVSKLEATECLAAISKWVIGLESVSKELQLLESKYPLINIDAFTYYIIAFITLRTKKAFLVAIATDKSELNIASKGEGYFLQSRKSPRTTIKGLKKLGELGEAFVTGINGNNTKVELARLFKGEKEPAGKLIDMVFQTQVSHSTEQLGRKKAMKQLIGSIGLESYAIMRLLPIDDLEQHYKKSELYRDLFPLFQLVLKDKIFLTEEENKRDFGTNYNIYKVNRVKIILGKTRGKK